MAAQRGMSPNEPPSSPATTRDAAPLPFRIIRPAAAFLAGLRGANALDVIETGDAYLVRGALPGLEPGEIAISAQGRTITIHADQRINGERQSSSYVRRESRSTGYDYRRTFHRTLTLPEPVRADEAYARYEGGMLEITLPKAETGPPKRIEITGFGAHAGVSEQAPGRAGLETDALKPEP
jgi:HSP20 family protein